MFGCGRTKRKDPTYLNSKRIEKELIEDGRRNDKYIKLLLLGTGESGKTTIIKQMKILHIKGFSDAEKQEKIPIIKQNIHESIYTILYNLDRIVPPIEIGDVEVRKSAEFILRVGLEYNNFTDEYYDLVKSLWNNNDVQIAYKRANEYQLIDSTEQFLNQIDVIRTTGYVPSIQDILYCRVTTTSISEIKFDVSVPKKYGGGMAKFLMYDVGGQRGYRKKWISVFEGIHTILFLIAASDFDLKLREDQSQNRLVEAFKVFDDIFWSRFLRKAGMILFLNKQDVLKKKIEEGKRLEDFFPEFKNYKVPAKEGNWKNPYENAKCFMKQKILDITKDKRQPEMVGLIPGLCVLQELEPREVYIHYTIATDTKNIELVFNSIHDIVISSYLKNGVF